VKDQKVSKHDLDIVFSEQVCDFCAGISSPRWVGRDGGRYAYLVVGRRVLTSPHRPSRSADALQTQRSAACHAIMKI
jgi:hypothetical protein